MGGGGCGRHATSRRTIVVYSGKTHSPGLDDLSEREEQRGDPKKIRKIITKAAVVRVLHNDDINVIVLNETIKDHA
jgi:hypothetical protein